MRQLKVDLADLQDALDNQFPEHHFFLDLETGAVVLVSDETNRELEALYAELGEAAQDPDGVRAAIEQRNLPDCQKEELRVADQVEVGHGTRYIRIEPLKPHADYEDKDVLDDYPRERQRWFAFKDAQARQRVLDWLAEEGIEPIIEPTTPLPASPPTPPARTRLLAEVLAFVRVARQLPGVTRVALIGTLTTDEPEPKDTDLATLATLGRKLQGHAQGFNHGGEVFLADARGNYLGRTCPWKQCAPDVRMSCDALHCGKRHYLHDDLETIRLASDLAVSPPVVLWPKIVARVPIPADVEQELIAPLRELN